MILNNIFKNILDSNSSAMLLFYQGILCFITITVFFLIGTYLPTFSSVIRHVVGLYDKFEVDRRLKSLHGLRSHIILRQMVVVSNGGEKK